MCCTVYRITESVSEWELDRESEYLGNVSRFICIVDICWEQHFHMIWHWHRTVRHRKALPFRLFAFPLVPCAIHYLSQVNIFISNCSLAICFRFIGRVNARHWHDKTGMNDGPVESGWAEWLTRTGRERGETHRHWRSSDVWVNAFSW